MLISVDCEAVFFLFFLQDDSLFPGLLPSNRTVNLPTLKIEAGSLNWL